MSKKRERKRKPARKKAFRNPKPLLLIVCEGEVTEKQYLQGFVNHCNNPRVQIEIAKEVGRPLRVVEIACELKTESSKQARQQKDDNLVYDSVWAVFDVDDHPHLTTAIEKARDNQIDLAISNPCFELWLLLHFQVSPVMKDRKTIRSMLKDHKPKYEKSVAYEDYEIGYEDAVKRARKLDAWDREKCKPGCNPSTEVYRLTESIRE